MGFGIAPTSPKPNGAAKARGINGAIGRRETEAGPVTSVTLFENGVTDTYEGMLGYEDDCRTCHIHK